MSVPKTTDTKTAGSPSAEFLLHLAKENEAMADHMEGQSSDDIVTGLREAAAAWRRRAVELCNG